jgi:glucans biosynthesis protein
MIDRRSLLAGAAAAAAGVKLAGAQVKRELYFPAEAPFSFQSLIARAQALSTQPYVEPAIANRALIDRIDFDEYQEIKFNPDYAIWADGGGSYPIELFHVGKFFTAPVRIFVVGSNGLAREVRYSPELFSYGTTEFAKALPPDTGFAGFRVMESMSEPDWLAFLGASYFRSSGETRQYGMSSRGLAIDVAMPNPEEFPRFSSFWLEALPGEPGLVVNALLESPRITGAYRFVVTHKMGARMDVEAHLFPREPIGRAGIAPLTSMFWYGKYNRNDGVDWRPEIHDTDGLAIWTGAGERIWRPLNNPMAVQTSTFFDDNPKGFGFLQRERSFSCYQDDGAFYDKRPSVWVEPDGAWGAGAVQLVEIPTHDEIHDNIVAYWVPRGPVNAGQHIALRYKLHWLLDEPYPAPLGRVVGTRRGAGGIPGRPPIKGVFKYVVDFRGGRLSECTKRGDLDIDVTAPTGRIERAVAYPVVGTDIWRAMFDFTPAVPEPVDLRLYLRRRNEALSETWIFQHLPTPSDFNGGKPRQS